MKRIVAAVAVLASLGAVAVAQGVVVQEFSFQIKDIKTVGRATRSSSTRAATTRAAASRTSSTRTTSACPKGAVVRKEFQNKRYYCEAKKLVDKVRMDKGSGRFTPYLRSS